MKIAGVKCHSLLLVILDFIFCDKKGSKIRLSCKKEPDLGYRNTGTGMLLRSRD